MIHCLRPIGLSLAILALVFTGCDGKKMVKVHGKILKGGQPLVVSEDTYVTLSFVLEGAGTEQGGSHSAKFDPKTGTYTVELPAGSYRTMLVVALPPKKDGKGTLNAPGRPVKSDKVYELTKDQELNVEVP